MNGFGGKSNLRMVKYEYIPRRGKKRENGKTAKEMAKLCLHPHKPVLKNKIIHEQSVTWKCIFWGSNWV